MKTKKLNEAFKWSEICKIEPIWGKVYDEEGQERAEEIMSIELVLKNGERIRITGNAYYGIEGEKPLCTLNIHKSKWEEIKK